MFRKLEASSLSLQIFAMLSAHFLIFSIFVMFMHLFINYPISLYAIFYPFGLFTRYSLLLSLCYLPTVLVTSVIYSKLVMRYKIAWDFGLTLVISQLILSLLYSRTTSTWYLGILGVYCGLFILLSQYICMHFETEPIDIQMQPMKRNE
eukprot:NODE_33_length_32023_cov_0.217579.p20 type:complete len:149 gc:universal NODE_33_length_32023_cov_0.217579:27620-28066(+)